LKHQIIESALYNCYPLLASVRRCDTYALNLTALWTRFNGELPPQSARKILIAGCGSFAPYPFAVSNPDIPITALDLSQANLKRARKHCLLHGIRNVTFCQADLLDQECAKGPYGFIDTFGVIHHLENPLLGLQSLAARLSDNGIIRLMVYSRYARKEEESIRRAFRLLGVRDSATAKQLIKRSKPGSRLKRYAETSFEARSVSGMADALLHPCVTTYTIDRFLELVKLSGLKLLQFAHNGALDDVEAEEERIRRMESVRSSPGNFVAFLGLNTKGPCMSQKNALLQLNPCLIKCVSKAGFADIDIPPRFGRENPLIKRRERLKLRRFTNPVKAEDLSSEELSDADVYRKALFLLQYRQRS
jgi:2-polyprenyl-3-methyl-5-hydroxy-6-metoxy-1,4-benzoquinol methylase